MAEFLEKKNTAFWIFKKNLRCASVFFNAKGRFLEVLEISRIKNKNKIMMALVMIIKIDNNMNN